MGHPTVVGVPLRLPLVPLYSHGVFTSASQ
jgi:hypothetical protein